MREAQQEWLAEHQRESQALSALFGGSVAYLVDEYERRGFLTLHDAELLKWKAGAAASQRWLADAARQLDALSPKL